MFFPVTGANGKKALINLDTIFSLIENGDKTVALSTGGTTFEINMPLGEIYASLMELEEEDGE